MGFDHLLLNFPGTKDFINWWKKENRLRMLCRSFSSNNNFELVPHSSNIVEVEHSQIEIEKPRNSTRKSVAICLWKRDCHLFDMVLAKSEGIQLTYYINDSLTRFTRNQRRRNKTINDGRAPDTLSSIQKELLMRFQN